MPEDGLSIGRNMQHTCKATFWIEINLCCVRPNKCSLFNNQNLIFPVGLSVIFALHHSMANFSGTEYPDMWPNCSLLTTKIRVCGSPHAILLTIPVTALYSGFRNSKSQPEYRVFANNDRYYHKKCHNCPFPLGDGLECSMHGAESKR